MGHPYAPAELQLPGFVPLQLSQGQILAPYLGTSLFVLVAIWLISGAVTLLLVQTHHFLGCNFSASYNWRSRLYLNLFHCLVQSPYQY